MSATDRGFVQRSYNHIPAYVNLQIMAVRHLVPKWSLVKSVKDPVLLLLLSILAVSLLAFLGGVIPYPYGLLLLLVLIAARILSRL